MYKVWELRKLAAVLHVTSKQPAALQIIPHLATNTQILLFNTEAALCFPK